MQQFNVYSSAVLVTTVHADDLEAAIAQVGISNATRCGDMAFQWFMDAEGNSYAIEIIAE